MPLKKRPTLAYALSELLAVLLAVSSIVGLLYGGGGFYDSYPASLAGLVGQDGVTLVVGIPLLVASMWLTTRGSVSGLLIWAGALFYFAYSYFFYVVGGFNGLFLLYIAIVSTSFYGLLSLLFAIDPEALRDRFGAGTPTRLAGGFLVGISLLFVFMWGGMSISIAAAGERPEEVLREVVIIDCAILLPLLLFGGVQLWRRQAWGYVLGGLLLVKALATGSTLAFNTALGAWWARAINPFDAFLFVLFALMAAAALPLLVAYLRGIQQERRRKTNLR